MAKILILIPWFHPAYKAGGPIRSVANMVAQFDEGDMEFKIFCSNQDLGGSTLENVIPEKWVKYNNNTEVWYSSTKHFQAELNRVLKEFKPNLLFINGIYSWPYNLKPILFSGKIQKVVSVRGMLHPGALAQKSIKKKLYLACWKMMRLPERLIFHVTDEQEQLHVQGVFGKRARLVVAANFPGVFECQSLNGKETGRLKLVSVGLISPMKNILLVLESLMRVGKEYHIEYSIYGPVKDNAYWQKCLSCITELPSNIEVHYKGDLPPSGLLNVLAENEVFILPSKSENFGHAIYEALSAGRPVITSDKTPWINLQDSKAGINVFMEDKNGLVSAIRLFAEMTNEELQEWSCAASHYAASVVDMKKIKKQYQSLFELEQ